MSYLGQALKALRPAHNFRVENGTTIIWQDERPQPTEEEINAKIAKLQAEYDAKQYQRDRAVAYPSIPDQLDTIYHQGLDAWKAEIKAIKDKYPKP